MGSIPGKTRFPLLLVLVAGLTPAYAQWSSRLQNGGEVVVDPTTNRITVTRDGVTTPLWDGVHRLEDGSVVTVRSGQVVPNEDILRARKPPPVDAEQPSVRWEGTPIMGMSPCEQLVERVCGVNGRCNEAPACAPARQLLEMEREERAKSQHPENTTFTSGQCIDASKDAEFFRECLP